MNKFNDMIKHRLLKLYLKSIFEAWKVQKIFHTNINLHSSQINFVFLLLLFYKLAYDIRMNI